MPLPVTRAKRLRVIELSKQGKPLRAIAAEVGCSATTALRVVHAYRDEERIRDTSRPSWPRVTNDLTAVAAVVDEPLHGARLSCINSSRRRSLRPSEYSSWTVDQWQSVVFANKSTIYCKWDNSQHSWRPLQKWNDPFLVRQLREISWPFVNVWTFVTYEGIGPIHRVEGGSFTPDSYVDVVDGILMPFLHSVPFRDGGVLLQQDSMPTNSSSRVLQCLADHGITQMPWPPEFEGLNPIRNAWALLKERLRRHRLSDPSPDQLWALIKKEWDRLRDIPNLARTFYALLPEKMQEVVTSKGALVTATKGPFANSQCKDTKVDDENSDTDDGDSMIV
ncbi:hypothetical protein HPB50_026179 [Hyalomma asiaticum]|uniref:Uncharacterized protein n=1 Tax=Hyalomma asiaticum TaxID=266040 RepID=A0ACB7RKV3_HYAAI|nr:hypothetical protein HPB50_026179 [Hyalomma asiaticum]